mmetsp:Transcript_35371/g.84789  ORF Transcript_35371/g.84789 Transcript_35371/m.84789 type:complete len:212 (+) Transcript_35371:706-1341(+)
MLQHLGCGRSLVRVEGEHERDALFGFSRHIIPVLRWKGEVTFLDHAENVGILVAIERWITTQQNVADDSTAPHITLLVVAALQHLRRHVVGRAGLGLHLLAGTHLVLLGEAKVNHLDLRVDVPVLQEEVLRLDVAVNEVVVVEVAHGTQNLLHVGCCTPLIEGPGCIGAFVLLCLLKDSIKKLTSRAELHDKVHLLGVQEDLIELHDVWVI